ncbi:DNA polymerase [Oceanimonas doudoroffii]|uniref:DNA polymerase n=1 Tax=Oceanimonas doudoroffii TaxID=84158 RepID=UPI00146ADAE6|nr:DNA polymerase [Oceanimonas doudoroffii]
MDAEAVARAAFDKVLTDTFREGAPRDLVGVSINHPCLDHEILVLFGDKTETTTEKIMSVIASVQQSKKELDFDDTMEVKVTRVTPPEGSGYRKMIKGRFEDVFTRHSGGHGSVFIKIKNNDWLCFARAVVVARARIQYYTLGDKSVKWDTIRRGDSDRRSSQRILALDLMTRAGLLGGQKRTCGVPEFKKIQNLLVPEGFQLKIFSHDHFDSRIFDDELVGPIPLYIYHHDNHFTPMSSPRILTGTNYFCDMCNQGYNKKEAHKCSAYCACCKMQGKCPQTRWIHCKDCNRRFKSQECFDNHLKKPEKFTRGAKNKRRKVMGQNTCTKLKLCTQCGRTTSKSLLPPYKHRCGQKYCSVCKIWDKNEAIHQCYMQPIKTKQNAEPEKSDLLQEEMEVQPDDIDSLVREEENRQGETDVGRMQHFQKFSGATDKVSKYLFWDFETTQQQEYAKESNALGPSYLHKPNYCIVRKACMLCKVFWLSQCENRSCKSRSCQDCQKSKPECRICVEHCVRFYGDNCKEEFCDFLFRECHRGTTAIAHNAKGFDAHFIIQWLVSQKRIPKIIPRGLKILSLEAMGVKIIDSISFLPQRLSSLPKTMNEPELKKGYFPYLFCRSENWNYVGAYPDADQYCPSQMKPAERNDFYTWYNAHKNKVFDFQKELREYTESDVDILLRCVLKFNDLFHAETGVYPLEVAITIAQACNHVFRKNFLKKNTIGVR